MATFILLFFGIIVVAALFAMVKIQRAEYFAARDAKAKQQSRIEAFRAKCYRPDGD